MSKAMCQLNRVVAVLALIVAAAAAAGTASVLIDSRATTGAWAGPASLTQQILGHSAAWLGTQIALHAGAVLAVALLVALVALVIIGLELRQVARRAPRLILSRGALGEVAINLDQVGRLAQREAEHIAGVREVATSAHSGKSGIDVQQTIAVEPQVALAPLAEQIQQRVKKSLEYTLGFPVARVQVLLQQASLRKTVV